MCEDRTSQTPKALELSHSVSIFLDFLRAVSAQLVLLGHSFDFFGLFSSIGTINPPPQIQRLGVACFFLLSGFLIANSVDRKRRHNYSFKHYFVDRFSRIYTALIPCLIFIALIDFLPFSSFEKDYPIHTGTTVWFINLFQLQYFPFTNWPVFGTGFPLWSLSVEWWLYILFGAIVLMSRKSTLFWLIVGLSGLPCLWNVFEIPGMGVVLAWGMGVLVYYAIRLNRIKLSTGLSTVVGCLLFLGYVGRLYFFNPRVDYKSFEPLSLLLLGLLFAVIINQLQGSSLNISRVKSVFGFFAQYSFTLYLIHFSLLAVLYEFRGNIGSPELILVSLFGCNLVAILWWWIFERHYRKLRQFLQQRIS